MNKTDIIDFFSPLLSNVDPKLYSLIIIHTFVKGYYENINGWQKALNDF